MDELLSVLGLMLAVSVVTAAGGALVLLISAFFHLLDNLFR